MEKCICLHGNKKASISKWVGERRKNVQPLNKYSIWAIITRPLLLLTFLLSNTLCCRCFTITAADGGESGSSNGEEKAGKAGKAGKAEGDAGPSCSSLPSKAGGDSKSRFFDDSEESEEGEEEEGSDEEVRAGDQNRF